MTQEASIPDWILAVAAIVAVVGTVATLWKLMRRDEQKQAMIDSLATQASALKDQVKELAVQSFHMGNIHKVLADALSQRADQQVTRNSIRRNDIMPYLRDTSDSFGSAFNVTLELVNSGSLARSVELSEISDDEINLSLSDVMVEAGDHFKIVGSSTAGKLHGRYSFVLRYEDADGNRYRQRFQASSINLAESRPEPDT